MHDEGAEPHERVDERVDEQEAQLTVDARALTVHLQLAGIFGGGCASADVVLEGSDVLVADGVGGVGTLHR